LAQFGLTERDTHEASGAIRGYLFDQYVRACGFTPTGSWVFVVLPSGDCEFTTLDSDEPRWCCEHRAEISARLSPPTVGLPPGQSDRNIATSRREAKMTNNQITHDSTPPRSVDERLQTLDEAEMVIRGRQSGSAAFDNGFDNVSG